MTTLSFEGQGVVVVGLAREGNAVAKFLAERGAKVSVTDARPAKKLSQTSILCVLWVSPFI